MCALQYKRADGTGLNAELFTPPGYDAERDGPLPCILWAYPRCALRTTVGMLWGCP